MNAAADSDDFEDTEIRDQFGNPPLVKIAAAERATMNAKTETNVDNRRDYSTNKALPWFVLLAVIASVSLGGWIASLDRISDVNDRASRAEERADLLQYYIMELDGKLMQWNVLKPQESFAGQMRAREEAKQQSQKVEKQ